MPLPKDKAWFAVKTYGWGWGLPLRWQGWVVLAAFFGGVLAGAPLAKTSLPLFAAYSVVLCAALIGFCYWKGEKAGWRWGARRKNKEDAQSNF